MPSGGTRLTVSIWRSTALYDKPRFVFQTKPKNWAKVIRANNIKAE
jgi:hypothetical protein